VNVLFGGSLDQILAAIRQIQLISFPSIVQIQYPMNALVFYQIIVKLSQIDMFQGE